MTDVAERTDGEIGPRIDIRTRPDASVILKPTGDLDWVSSVSLRHVVEDVLHPLARFVVDLEEVQNIDAVGVSALIGSIRRARSVGGDLRVVNPRPAVQRALRLADVYGRLSCVAGEVRRSS